MSWSIDVTGTKSEVSEKVTEQLDAIAKGKEEAKDARGKEEAKDVRVAKERILAIVQAVALTKQEDMSPSSPAAWNAVNVKAAGSHTLTEHGIARATMTLVIERKHV